MKDEIKEILQDLEKVAKCEYYPEDLLYYENCQKLLDYITTLQEDLKVACEVIEKLKNDKKKQ